MERMLKRAITAGTAAVLPFLSAAAAHAQTSTTTPNTGAGGDAVMNLMVMGISFAVAIAGLAYLRILPRRG